MPLHTAVGNFAAPIRQAVAARAPAALKVGNLDTIRDFVDIGDACEALVALAERGRTGEIYDVCSGRPTLMRELLRDLVASAPEARLTIEESALTHPLREIPRSLGNPAAIAADTGWRARTSLEASIRSVLA
jgi:GDP-4-dehydro-6-deoxy-D-mannose reductase